MKQTKQLVPELRFPEFDGEWKQDSLNKLANVNPRTRKLPDEFIYIDLESVTEGKLVKEETVFADEAPSRAQKVLDKGDILYQTVRPYQKNNYFFNKDGDYVASTGYAQIKAKYYSKYLFQFLHNQKFVNIVNRWSTGTSYPAISPSELVKIKINYPTAPEQQKIADFLSQVDNKIDLLSQKLEHLEQYKKGVMQKLFSQEVRFKKDDGSDFPDWEEKRLGAIAIKKSSSISANKIEDNHGEFKIYGANGLLKTVDFYQEKDEFISIVKDGAGVGRVLLCDAYSSVLGTLDIIKPNVTTNIYFLFSLLSMFKFERYTTGSTIPHIYFKDYSKQKIKITSLAEQTKIANYLSAIDQKISFTQQQLEQTQQFKKGLLQKMFV